MKKKISASTILKQGALRLWQARQAIWPIVMGYCLLALVIQGFVRPRLEENEKGLPELFCLAMVSAVAVIYRILVTYRICMPRSEDRTRPIEAFRRFLTGLSTRKEILGLVLVLLVAEVGSIVGFGFFINQASKKTLNLGAPFLGLYLAELFSVLGLAIVLILTSAIWQWAFALAVRAQFEGESKRLINVLHAERLAFLTVLRSLFVLYGNFGCATGLSAIVFTSIATKFHVSVGAKFLIELVFGASSGILIGLVGSAAVAEICRQQPLETRLKPEK